MKRTKRIPFGLAAVLVALAAIPHPVLACATCFGASDSDLAKGMNMGILSLLAVVIVVLGGIASFFIYLARRSAALANRPASAVENSSGS